jgi:hypothetical protein
MSNQRDRVSGGFGFWGPRSCPAFLSSEIVTEQNRAILEEEMLAIAPDGVQHLQQIYRNHHFGKRGIVMASSGKVTDEDIQN